MISLESQWQAFVNDVFLKFLSRKLAVFNYMESKQLKLGKWGRQYSQKLSLSPCVGKEFERKRNASIKIENCSVLEFVSWASSGMSLQTAFSGFKKVQPLKCVHPIF